MSVMTASRATSDRNLRYNPARGISVWKVRSLLESYLEGNYGELMWTFGAPYVGIESADPDYFALIEKRTTALSQMDWDIRTLNDSPEATRQAEILRKAYESIGNLSSVIEHLSMAPLRGFAHCEVDPLKWKIRVVPQWNIVRDGLSGPWKYNPEALFTSFTGLSSDLTIDTQRQWWLIRECPRVIGGWALLKFYYSALSLRDWAEFCSIYGIPGGVVVGPPNVPEDKEKEYETAAEAIAGGGRGYLPNGAEWKVNDSPRGTQPFKDFQDYLTQKLILAGTGGMLTMLNEGTGLGSGQSESHQDTFAQIARAEALKISEILNAQFDCHVLEMAGLIQPGQRPMAYWQLAAQEDVDTGTVITQVQGLSQAGFRVDQQQVEERTGYRVAPMALPEGPLMRTNAQEPCAKLVQNAAKRRTRPTVAKSGVLRNTAKKTAGDQFRTQMRAVVDRISNPDVSAEEAKQAVKDGLKLLDELTPELLETDDLAGELESRLMEAVITGASSMPVGKSSKAASRVGGDL